MGKAFVLVTIVFSITSLLYAPPDEANIEALVKGYKIYRSNLASEQSLHQSIENIFFARFVLFISNENSLQNFQRESWYRVLDRIAKEQNLHLVKHAPPFQTDLEFEQLLIAARSGDPKLIEEMHKMLNRKLEIARQEIKIPIVILQLTPQLQSILPKNISPLQVNSDGKASISLNQKAGGLDRVGLALELIASTPSGQKLLQNFLPLLLRGEVTFERFTEEVKKEASNTHFYLAAAYKPIPQQDLSTGQFRVKGIIYLDPDVELGVLVEDLFHEAVHAIDPNLDMHYKKIGEYKLKKEALKSLKLTPEVVHEISRIENLISANKNQIVFDSERKAYSETSVFRQEFLVRFPTGVREYVDAHINRGGLNPDFVSDDFIRSYYLNSHQDVGALLLYPNKLDCTSGFQKLAPPP